jgi:MHS family alpha-ketoglutarate permease-like MFS transporter
MTAVADSPSPAVSSAAPITVGRRIRSIFGGSVGNLIEWYDWFAYSAFSLYFAPVFFPSDDPVAQLLSTAAVFAVGFLMRPVGGWSPPPCATPRPRAASLKIEAC